MDVRFQNNSLSVSYQNKNFQLHPIWLRERLPGEEFFDVDTHQRLYEPSSIDLDLQIVELWMVRTRERNGVRMINAQHASPGKHNVRNSAVR